MCFSYSTKQNSNQHENSSTPKVSLLQRQPHQNQIINAKKVHKKFQPALLHAMLIRDWKMSFYIECLQFHDYCRLAFLLQKNLGLCLFIWTQKSSQALISNTTESMLLNMKYVYCAELIPLLFWFKWFLVHFHFLRESAHLDHSFMIVLCVFWKSPAHQITPFIYQLSVLPPLSCLHVVQR